MIVDRMALADLGNPVAIASAVLKQIPEVVPTPVEAIAAAVGITDIGELQSNGFEGALITDQDKMDGVILCKRGTMPERRRFTICHELGHYLNPWHVPSGAGFECTSVQMLQGDAAKLAGRPKWEAEANAFASELLMPSHLFNADARKIRTLGIEAIQKLAEKYKVSKLACSRKVVAIGQEHCAVLVSRNGIIEGIYRSKEFPYIFLGVGMELPAKSLSRTFVGHEGDASELDSTEASFWINKQIRANCFEQVLLQRNGWRLTLLICEDEDEDEFQEDDYRSSWSRR